MADQRSFAGIAWTNKGKLTRRERFLTEMDALIPWKRLIPLIEPHYPKRGRGRPPLEGSSHRTTIRARSPIENSQEGWRAAHLVRRANATFSTHTDYWTLRAATSISILGSGPRLGLRYRQRLSTQRT